MAKALRHSGTKAARPPGGIRAATTTCPECCEQGVCNRHCCGPLGVPAINCPCSNPACIYRYTGRASSRGRFSMQNTEPQVFEMQWDTGDKFQVFQGSSAIFQCERQQILVMPPQPPPAFPPNNASIGYNLSQGAPMSIAGLASASVASYGLPDPPPRLAQGFLIEFGTPSFVTALLRVAYSLSNNTFSARWMSNGAQDPGVQRTHSFSVTPIATTGGFTSGIRIVAGLRMVYPAPFFWEIDFQIEELICEMQGLSACPGPELPTDPRVLDSILRQRGPDGCCG